MYQLTEQQISYIADDISARGIGMVSLQQDLLDHICCIIEQELEADGDFGRLYPLVISRFYKSELKEIETETVYLLTNKNYYKMKKIMLASGVTSVGMLTAGIILKFLHLPGASLLLVLGIFLMSFLFLPLMFVLRVEENQEKSQKAISIVGGICAILISLGVLFKIMHWPGANVMCTVALLMMIFIFIPVYFFTGFRNPATKTNTVLTSIMMFTACMLVLMLVRSPHGTQAEYVSNTRAFEQNNLLVKNEMRLTDASAQTDSKGQEIFQLCEEIKAYLINEQTVNYSLSNGKKVTKVLIGDDWSYQFFADIPDETAKLNKLEKLVADYNKNATGLQQKINDDIFKLEDRLPVMLNNIILMQMQVLQNRRELVAMK